MISRSFGGWTYRSSSKEAMANHGIFVRSVYRNLTPAQYYEIGCNRKPGNPGTEASRISSTGAFCAYSGEKTGRTPKDKRIVKDEVTEKDVWWGSVNMPISPEKFAAMEERARDYL